MTKGREAMTPDERARELTDDEDFAGFIAQAIEEAVRAERERAEKVEAELKLVVDEREQAQELSRLYHRKSTEAEADAAALRLALSQWVYERDELNSCYRCIDCGRSDLEDHADDCQVKEILATDHPGDDLLAERGRLREALEPFARVADRFPVESYPRGFDFSGVGECFTLGQIRAARAALAGPKGATK